LEAQVDPRELKRVESRMASLESEPDDEEQERRMSLLQRQRDSIKALDKRRRKTSRNLESCVLAMQNVRLTQATMQARSLSRDVDNAIDAVGEVRDVLRS